MCICNQLYFLYEGVSLHLTFSGRGISGDLNLGICLLSCGVLHIKFYLQSRCRITSQEMKENFRAKLTLCGKKREELPLKNLIDKVRGEISCSPINKGNVFFQQY